MSTIKNKIKATILPVLVAGFIFTSCNKDVQQFAPITQVPITTGKRLADAIAATPSDTLYSKLIIRSGLTSVLNDSTKKYTLFATDNNGMKIFINAISSGAVPLGAPDATFVGFINTSISQSTAASIISYNLAGQVLPSSSIPTTFPNTPVNTFIPLDPTYTFLTNKIFPVKGTPYSYVNNIPISLFDVYAANGVIQHTYTLVTPPSLLLRNMIAAEPTLSYFRAAITRADSGQVVKPGGDSTNFFNYLLGYGLTNMTVLTPNDAAFQQLVFGLAFSGYLATRPQPYTHTDTLTATATANGAVAAGPAFLATNNVSTATVRGIMAYHFLAAPSGASYAPSIRVFSVNVPATPKFIPTLVNASVAVHPGVMAVATYTGPSVTTLKFTGLGTFPPGGAAFSGPAANAVAFDKLAVNGIYHIIDKVLLPQ